MGKIADIFDNQRVPVAANERIKGKIPYYGANGIQDYVDGFTHQGEFVLLAEDGANDTKNYPCEYVEGKIWVNNHAHVLSGKKNLLNNLFLTSRIKSMDISPYLVGGGRAKLNAKVMLKIELSIPTLPEQQKIGNLFKQLARLITLHKRKWDDVILLKKALLQKMFPKNGSDFPEIRFPEFTDAWEKWELGDFGQTVSGVGFPDREQGNKEGIPFIKVSDMNNIGNENEMINCNNYVTNEQIIKNNWKPIISVPAILFAKVGAAIMLNRKRIISSPFLIDNNMMAYCLTKKLDLFFVKNLFETINLPKYAQTGALPSYNGSDIERIKVFIPTNLLEQQKIGNLFKQLDRLITLHK